MTIYVATFILTSLLVQAAGRSITAIPRMMLGAPAILIMAIVAGARDFGVGGPDALAYGNAIFVAAHQSHTPSDLASSVHSVYSAGEYGYLTLNFLVSRLSGDPHIFYFFLSLFVSTLIFAAIMLMRDYGPTGLMWFTYLCTSYVDTFVLLRQGPALALALLGLALVVRRRRWVGLAVGLCGLAFHSSAVVFVVVWGVAIFVAYRDKHELRRSIIVLACAGAVSLAGAPILTFIVGFGDGRFDAYLTTTARQGAAVATDALYRLVPIVASMIAYFHLRRDLARPQVATAAQYSSNTGVGLPLQVKPKTVLESSPRRPTPTMDPSLIVLILATLLCVDLLLLPLREISYPVYRVLTYFGYAKIFAYAVVAHSFKTHRLLAQLAGAIFVLAYFVLVVVLRNGGEYSSSVLTSWFTG